jgi:HEAT repeat protein
MPNLDLKLPYVMLLAVGLIAILVVALLIFTVGVKGLRAFKTSRYDSRRRRIEPYLDLFLEQGDQSGLKALGMRDKDRYLAPLIMERMTVLRGEDRERLRSLSRELGLVERYLSELSSRGRWTRARAAERLGYFGGEEEVAPIAKLLPDEDETVRAVAARSLARIGSEEAVEALVRTLDAPSEMTRLRVAENLDRVGRAAVRPLVALLEENLGPERRESSHGPVFASRVLGGLRAPEARPSLRRAVREGVTPDIRAQAARALGMISDPEDVPLLLESAEDEAWPVRVQAANALGMIGEAYTIPTLEGMILDREWWVRSVAAGALANMGRSGEDSLVGLLGSPDRYARDRAAATLEGRGITRRFVKQLTLDNERGVRARTAISALARSGNTRHLHYLLQEMPENEQSHELRKLLRAETATGLE